MSNQTTTIRVDKKQSIRAKKLKEKYDIRVKIIFEKGLRFFENEKEYEYHRLLKEKEKIEIDLVSQNAKIETKRRELKIVADNFHDALNDVLILWKESDKELDVFCQKNLEYLARIMGKYKEIKSLEDFKKYLSEKKNF